MCGICGFTGHLATSEEILEKMKNVDVCEKQVTIKSAMKDKDVVAMEELADELLSE